MRPSVLAQLRDFVPIRPLTRHEALSIAERQAQKFLEIVDVTEPPVPEAIISRLPRIQVERVSPWPTSGAADWVRGQWVVILNGAEPTVRQRFSLAHEFKHIVDNRFIADLYRGERLQCRRRWIEQICDYFAGCLLVPRPWLRRAWATDTQDLEQLAWRFHVSQAAMQTRLNQTGLSAPAPRCIRPERQWAIESIKTGGADALYHRTPTPQLVI